MRRWLRLCSVTFARTFRLLVAATSSSSISSIFPVGSCGFGFYHQIFDVRMVRIQPPADAAHKSCRKHGIGHKVGHRNTTIDKFIAKRSRRPFALEGPGYIYVVARIAHKNAHKFGELRVDERLEVLDLKGGHTRQMDRHPCEYTSCGRGQNIIWICKYTVTRRYYCERLLYLCLFGMGGVRAGGRCPCDTLHRKFLLFETVGGLQAFHGVMEKVLEFMGEEMERSFFAPAVETQVIYEFICAERPTRNFGGGNEAGYELTIDRLS
ncbi:hypothetical protein C8R45DRAFT_945396 [Mycena sanguinolenta]|nr:hypothetical protein C8R45DRAFT_945396 [Mycena sanguinolenta]